MRRTITELRVDERKCFAILFALRFFGCGGYRQVHPATLAVSPLVQARDDFLNGPPDSLDISPLVATNGVLPLHDDVAVPAGTDHVPGRVCRLHGYDLIVFCVQGANALLRLTRAGPNVALRSSSATVGEMLPT